MFVREPCSIWTYLGPIPCFSAQQQPWRLHSHHGFLVPKGLILKELWLSLSTYPVTPWRIPSEPAFSLPNSIRAEDWGEKRSLLKTLKGKYIRFHCMGQEIIVWFKQYTNQELGNEMVVDEGLWKTLTYFQEMRSPCTWPGQYILRKDWLHKQEEKAKTEL